MMTTVKDKVSKAPILYPLPLVVTNDANGAFLGTVEVRAGILEAQSALTTTLNVLGSRAENTITVSEGAQLLARVPAGKNQYAQRFPNNLVPSGGRSGRRSGFR